MVITGQGNVQTASFTSTNTINSAVEVDDQSDTSQFLAAPGVIDTSNKIYVPYIDSDNQISVASWTSADTPTPSVDATVGDNTVYGNGLTSAPFVAACLAIDTDSVHLAYADATTQALLYDDDVDGGGATDSEEGGSPSLVVDRISINKGTSDLLYVYEEGGAARFGVISLGGATEFTITASLSGAVAAQQTLTASLNAGLARRRRRT
jgi:hypothetical protein